MLRAVVIVAVVEEIEAQNNDVRLVRRKIRDKANPLELPHTLFVKYFRVNKSAFKYLLGVLTEHLPPIRKSFAVPPIIQLCASLRFFAEGGYQTGVGKDFDVGLAQSSFSEVLSETLSVFEFKLCPKWIQMQKTTEEKCATKLHFYNKFKIPGVLGCIDGTHIRIIGPPENKHLFYNRKAFYSLNVMLVCDEAMQIRFVDATHPGASHDALIWRVSELKSWMEAQYLSGEENARLLGDAGYPLEPWLLTPHRTCIEGTPESKFNIAHKQCRNIIERTNGLLKSRWRCLLGARELHYSPLKAIKITNVCCALHNICLHFKTEAVNIPSDFNELGNEEASDEARNDMESSSMSTYAAAAQRIREQIGISL